jgi:hypothetical protein
MFVAVGPLSFVDDRRSTEPPSPQRRAVDASTPAARIHPWGPPTSCDLVAIKNVQMDQDGICHTYVILTVSGYFINQNNYSILLVVWNITGLCFYILGISSSQLANSYYSEG